MASFGKPHQICDSMTVFEQGLGLIFCVVAISSALISISVSIYGMQSFFFYLSLQRNADRRVA